MPVLDLPSERHSQKGDERSECLFSMIVVSQAAGWLRLSPNPEPQRLLPQYSLVLLAVNNKMGNDCHLVL